jgi:hypothetical protein
MKTVSGVISEVTEQLGYNPYLSFKNRYNAVVPFVDISSDEDADELLKSLVYSGLFAIRAAPISDFFKAVTPCMFNDVYIVGLMIEIYRRTRSTEVTRFDFPNSQYVEFDSWEDLLPVLEQLKPHYPFLQAYEGLESKLQTNYYSMSDQHLLNAFFQRAYNEISESSDKMQYACFNTQYLSKVSAQYDGFIAFLGPILLSR